MNCSYCGKKINHTDRYCPNCGSFNDQYDELKKNNFSSKERIKAGLLGIFLGSIGIHNFYLNQKKQGLIKLILGLVGIIGLILSIIIIFDAAFVDPVTGEVVITNQALATTSSLFLLLFLFLFIPMFLWGLGEAVYILLSKNITDGDGLKLK